MGRGRRRRIGRGDTEVVTSIYYRDRIGCRSGGNEVSGKAEGGFQHGSQARKNKIKK